MGPDFMEKETPLNLLQNITLTQVVSAGVLRACERGPCPLLPPTWIPVASVERALHHPSTTPLAQVIVLSFTTVIGIMIATFFLVLKTGAIRLNGLD